MGRQHTTWISEENWRKLENIGGDSVSAKIGNAISMADPDREMVFNAKMRQLERAKDALKRVLRCVDASTKATADDEVQNIKEILEDVWWLVNE